MKKIILSLIVLSVFGCTVDKNKDETGTKPVQADTPDKNPDENKDKIGLKLIQLISTDSEDKPTYKTTFTYLENGLLKSEVDENLINTKKITKREYTYNSNGKLDKIICHDGDRTTSTITFEYDGDLIVKGLDDYKHYDIYSYNSKNQLVSIEHSHSNKFNYDYDSSGNMVKFTPTLTSEPESKPVSYSYDTKKNPFLLVYPNACISLIIGNLTLAGENNWVSSNFEGYSHPPAKYIYNDSGYPIEVIKDSEREGVSIYKTKYIYNK